MRKRWLPALLVIAASPAAAQDSLPPPAAPAAGAAQAATFEQDVSYAIGLSIGSDLRQNDVRVDLRQLFTGIRDALTGAKPRLSEDQVAQVMMRYSQQQQKKAEAQMAQMAPLAAENKQKGEAFLAENAKKPGVTVTKSGLQYHVLKQGDGPSPKATSVVRCNYEGRSIDGEVFDASARHGGPAEFPLNRVIPGWTEVVQLMKVGDEFEVYIPGELAYGAQGRPPSIGPNETLVFKIELLGIVR